MILLATRPVPAKSARQQWQPLTAGNKWSYSVAREARVVGGPEGPQSVKRTGTATTEILGPSKLFRGPDPVFEIVTTNKEQADRGPGRATTETKHIAERVGGLYLHGQLVVGAPGVSTNLETYNPPLHLLLLPETAGAKWPVGESRQGPMRLALRGEVVGFENVSTPTSTYAHCLKVRYTATVTGALPSATSARPITKGTMEIVDWYASGVGLVKETTQSRIQYRGAKNAILTSTQSTTRMLTKAEVK